METLVDLGEHPGVVVLVDGSDVARRAVAVAAETASSGGGSGRLHLVWPFCIQDADRPPGSLHVLPSIAEYRAHLLPRAQQLLPAAYPDGLATVDVVWMRSREKMLAALGAAELLVIPRGSVDATLARITDRHVTAVRCPVRVIR